MTDTPPASSVVHDGEPGTLRSAALPAAQGLSFEKVKPVEPSTYLGEVLKSQGWVEKVMNGVHVYTHPSFDAIARDIEQRRERIARKLEP